MNKIRLFLSSPGDVESERKKVFSVAVQVNRMVGEMFDVQLEVIDWRTHGVPDIGRAQDIINRQIANYDIFVGMMWKRFGTPTGEVGSGTEEEFNIAYENWKHFKRPRILFYFSKAQYTIQNEEECLQLRKVLGFKERIKEKGLIFEYSTPEEFADLLREHIFKVLEEWFTPKIKKRKKADFNRYIGYLKSDTMYIDIRGLFTGKGKAHRFPIDQLYIPLKTTGSRFEEKGRGRGESEGITEEMSPGEISLQEALRKRRLIIKGEPGAGKTTFLRFITYALCQKWLGEEASSSTLKIFRTESYPLPILIRLGDLTAHIRERMGRDPASSIKEDNPECIFDFLEKMAEKYKWKVYAEDFRDELDSGNCLILLDGLDEAPDPKTRKKISALADNLLKTFHDCRVVLTSRPAALEGPAIPPGFDLVEILPLDEPAKEFFLTQWSNALYHDYPEKSEEFKRELSEALRAKPEIRRMASTPVMLTALAVVHWNEHRLPEQRFELYESIITWLIRAREERPGRLNADRCRKLLQKLALAMFAHPQGRQRQVGLKWAAETLSKEFAGTGEKPPLEQAEAFLHAEMVDSGIIVERENRLEFWHLSFQEYLAASEIAGLRDEAQIDLLFEGDRLYKSEWREVVLLLGGVLYKLGEEKINYLIDEIITREPKYKVKTSLPQLAKKVGILGSIVRDLSPFHFTPANQEYPEVIRSVMGIFDKESYKQIPLEVRIEAADSLGQVGDPRLDEVSMIVISGGPFWMGAQSINKRERNFDKDASDRESPVHRVELSSYEISKYPVTVGQYLKFIEDGGYEDGSYWKAGGFGKFEKPGKWEEQLRYPSRPVVYVSWYEAAAYAEWFGGRLPTEAEWERAARGPSGEYRRYPWGNDEPGKETANIYKTGIGKATPVGIFPEDCTPEGIVDMGGNVLEWCWDWYSGGYYNECAKEGVVRDPRGPDKGEVRVLGGGSFFVSYPYYLRCALRYGDGPGYRGVNVGFRVVRVIA